MPVVCTKTGRREPASALASMGTIASLEIISRRQGFATTYHKVVKVSIDTAATCANCLIPASERQDLVLWLDGKARETIFGNNGHCQRHVSFGESYAFQDLLVAHFVSGSCSTTLWKGPDFLVDTSMHKGHRDDGSNLFKSTKLSS